MQGLMRLFNVDRESLHDSLVYGFFKLLLFPLIGTGGVGFHCS